MKTVWRLKALSITHLVGLVALWRASLSFVSFLAVKYLPYQPTFPYVRELLTPYGSRILNAWAQFDGVHYLTIIIHGYRGTDLIQAFFPLYPLVIKLLAITTINILFLGIATSTVCFVVALFAITRLSKLIAPSASSLRIVLLLLFFPTSFFFTSFYTESLFLMLIVLSFWSIEKKSFALAGILGALASATRLTGIFVLPALLFVWWNHYKYMGFKGMIKPKVIASLVWCCLPILGLGSYMLYLNQNFSDPILFVHVQDKFGALRETDKLILLYQVIFRYVKMLLTVYPLSLTYFTVVFEFATGILGLIGTILVYKFLPRHYFIYTFLSYITPTLTGTFSSMPRYLLTIFPIFIVLSLKLSPKVFKIWLAVSAILLSITTIIFTTGKWVA